MLGRKLGHMRPILAASAVLVLPITINAGNAAPQAAPLSGSARPVIERFLQEQTAGLPGKVSIAIHTPMSGALPPCDAPEPFLPNSAHLWGRLSVGVRCTAPRPWTRYVPVYIGVTASYYVAARAISAGDALTAADFATHEGDLAMLPRSVITSAEQLEGVIAVNSIAAGAPLRRELLRPVTVVQTGQSVRVVVQGPGFVVRTQGKALRSAAIGAKTQIKTPNGQLLSGIVREDGSVEVLN